MGCESTLPASSPRVIPVPSRVAIRRRVSDLRPYTANAPKRQGKFQTAVSASGKNCASKSNACASSGSSDSSDAEIVGRNYFGQRRLRGRSAQRSTGRRRGPADFDGDIASGIPLNRRSRKRVNRLDKPNSSIASGSASRIGPSCPRYSRQLAAPWPVRRPSQRISCSIRAEAGANR